VLIERLYHRGLAQASYLIGCQATGEALVVDPNRDIEQYLAAAARHGLRITAIAETHIHADYLSGARALAARTGATLYVSDAGPPEWRYADADEVGAALLRDGDLIRVGNLQVQALHTPGHTPEHLAYLVAQSDGAVPVGLLSGDFVFVGDVGRPDLLERAVGVSGAMEEGARQLFASLGRFRALPEYLQVWPGHGAGSACGKSLGALPQTTVGYELRTNWALQIRDEGAFVDAVLEGQPDPPPYFARMKRLNQQGPPAPPAADLPQLDADALGRAGHGELFLLDIRPAAAFATCHIPGSVNIPAGDSLLKWAGWLVPYDRPIALVGEAEAAREVRRELLLIGLDDVAGFWTPAAIERWRSAGGETRTVERRRAAELLTLAQRPSTLVIDVRAADEHAAGHIPGSRHVPLGRLSEALSELPPERAIIVHCQSGYRSGIAASVLQAHGRAGVIDMEDGFDGWKAAGGPVAV